VAYFIVRSLCLPQDHKDLSQVGMISVRDVNQGHFEYESEPGCSYDLPYWGVSSKPRYWLQY
jgi:hypothetical protein